MCVLDFLAFPSESLIFLNVVLLLRDPYLTRLHSSLKVFYGASFLFCLGHRLVVVVSDSDLFLVILLVLKAPSKH